MINVVYFVGLGCRCVSDLQDFTLSVYLRNLLEGVYMPRSPRLVVEGESAVYHVMSRTALDHRQS